MSNMFDGCSLLKEFNLNNFDTNNVTDMSYIISIKFFKFNGFNTFTIQK